MQTVDYGSQLQLPSAIFSEHPNRKSFLTWLGREAHAPCFRFQQSHIVLDLIEYHGSGRSEGDAYLEAGIEIVYHTRPPLPLIIMADLFPSRFTSSQRR